MTNEQLNIYFKALIAVKDSKELQQMSRDDFGDTMRKWLADVGVYTHPLGSLWGVKCSKEEYLEYSQRNSKKFLN